MEHILFFLFEWYLSTFLVSHFQVRCFTLFSGCILFLHHLLTCPSYSIKVYIWEIIYLHLFLCDTLFLLCVFPFDCCVSQGFKARTCGDLGHSSSTSLVRWVAGSNPKSQKYWKIFKKRIKTEIDVLWISILRNMCTTYSKWIYVVVGVASYFHLVQWIVPYLCVANHLL